MSEEEKKDIAEEEVTTSTDAADEPEADKPESDEADSAEELHEEDAVTLLQSEVAALKDQVLRARAETENVRRRADRDKSEASAYAVTGFARDLLNVGDNLRRALDAMPEDAADNMKGFIEGVEMTERELLNIMERHGITKVNPEVGEKFDHKFHQAMFEVPTEEQAPGSVMQVVAPGYVIKDRLLRPAMVGVAKGEKKSVDTEA